MSETQPAPDWWLASDGRWYPPSSLPASEAAPSRQISGALAWATAVMLWLTGALSLVSAGAYFAEVGAFSDWVDAQTATNLDTWSDAEEARLGIWTLTSLLSLVTAVLVIIWTYQAARRMQTVGADRLYWTPGWAIGSWFIPLANLVIPKLVINQIDRVSRAAEFRRPVGESWREGRSLLVSHVWWGLWVLSAVLSTIGFFMINDEVREVNEQLSLADLDPDLYRGGLIVLGLGALAAAFAALLGGITIRAITSRD